MYTSSGQFKVAIQTYIQSIKDGQTKYLTIIILYKLTISYVLHPYMRKYSITDSPCPLKS